MCGDIVSVVGMAWSSRIEGVSPGPAEAVTRRDQLAIVAWEYEVLSTELGPVGLGGNQRYICSVQGPLQ